MAGLYDNAFNGGWAEFKFTGKGAPDGAAGEEVWTLASMAKAANADAEDSNRGISIVAVQWSINGGGNIAIEDEGATVQSANPHLLLSGNGSMHTGQHGISFSPILITKGKGIQLVPSGATVTGFTVIIKIRKEEGFGYTDPR